MLIIVMGMGRSGTSLIMQVLHGAGIDCGSDWISTNENNPKGYFELRQVMGFNRSFLQRISGDEKCLFPVPPREAIEKEIGKWIPPPLPPHDFAVKDPRFSLTFPLWYPTLKDRDLRIIQAKRNLEANAESIARAYYVDLQLARTLIDEYNHRAEYYVNQYQLPSVTIWYEDWFENPTQNCTLLETLVGRKLEVDLQRILDPNLVHCSGQVAEIRLEQLDRHSSPVPLNQIESDAWKENLFALENKERSWTEQLRKIKQTGSIHVSVQTPDCFHFQTDSQTNSDNETGLSEWVIPKIISEQHPPYNRYAGFDPSKHLLLIVGIDALNLDLLSRRLNHEVKHIVIIEPHWEMLAGYLTVHSIKTLIPLEEAHFFGGPGSWKKALDFLKGIPSRDRKIFYPLVSPQEMKSSLQDVNCFMQELKRLQ